MMEYSSEVQNKEFLKLNFNQALSKLRPGSKHRSTISLPMLYQTLVLPSFRSGMS